eukprot:scaffold5458_cov131-Isochrysis_galbana.AAC.8
MLRFSTMQCPRTWPEMRVIQAERGCPPENEQVKVAGQQQNMRSFPQSPRPVSQMDDHLAAGCSMMYLMASSHVWIFSASAS